MEAFLLVADLPHRAPRCGLNGVPGHAFGPPDFACKDDMIGGDERFAGNARQRIRGQVKIHHSIGNTVANLVGMAFRYRFTRKEVVSSRHVRFPSYETVSPRANVRSRF